MRYSADFSVSTAIDFALQFKKDSLFEKAKQEMWHCYNLRKI